ncbi:MAG: iron-sulfur cluster repair di-iron protein [Marivirga sp.]|nr:iron-sulfur cluster repair di-iron protein [Marivirga sp.]
MILTDNIPDIGSLSVADVAVAFPQSLEILSRYNLDYCCGGKKPFVKACEGAGLNAELILLEIRTSGDGYRSDATIKFETWNTSLLIDYIVQHHHQYVKDTVPQIMELLNKVCYVHRDDSLFLLEVRKLFNTLSGELLDHLEKEEKILFPTVRRMSGQREHNSSTVHSTYINDSAIAAMESEHEMAGQLIKAIRVLTNNYTPPNDACPTLRFMYIMIDQFDKDLMQHVHIENNILFPRVLQQT